MSRRPAAISRTGAGILRVSPGQAIFALALVVRLAWVLHLPEQLAWHDEQEFLDIARHLVHGDGYVATSFRANPVLPAYLAAVFGTVGEHFGAARAGQAILGAVTCTLVYRLGSLLLGPTVGTLAGTFLALYLPHVYLAGVFYVDCALIFLSVLALHLAARSVRPSVSYPLGLACGVTLGLTALTRGLFVLYLPCVCAAWLYAGRDRWPRRLGLCATAILGAALVLAPWAIRNQRAYGRFLLVSSGFGANLWQGHNPLSRGDPGDRFLSPSNNGPTYWEARLTTLPEAERRSVEAEYTQVFRRVDERAAQIGDAFLAQDDVLAPLAVRWIVAHPERVAPLMARRLLTLLSAFSTTETQNEHTRPLYAFAAAVFFYPMLILAALGMVLAFPHRRHLALLYLPIGAVIGAYSVLTASTRFRLPIDPLLIVFAALATRALWRTVRSRRTFRADPALDRLQPLAPRGLS